LSSNDDVKCFYASENAEQLFIGTITNGLYEMTKSAFSLYRSNTKLNSGNAVLLVDNILYTNAESNYYQMNAADKKVIIKPSPLLSIYGLNYGKDSSGRIYINERSGLGTNIYDAGLQFIKYQPFDTLRMFSMNFSTTKERYYDTSFKHFDKYFFLFANNFFMILLKKIRIN